MQRETIDAQKIQGDPQGPPALWRHQEEAYEFLKCRPATLLAMDMGTGKSATVIRYLKDLDESLVLILCPKPVLSVWERELERHWPDGPYELESLKSLKATETAEEKCRRAWAALERPGLQIVLCNYEAAIRPALSNLFKSSDWDLLVLDESHRVKAPGGKASWLARSLGPRARKRLCLTGTPLPHGPLDAYAQFRFLDPDIFGTSFARFKERYAVLGGYQNRQVVGYCDLEDFNEKFSSITFRVAIDEVLELPEAVHQEFPVELDSRSRRIYEEMDEHFVTGVRDRVVTASNALSKLLRLQQITSGVLPLETGTGCERIGREKYHALMALLEDLPEDEPVVVFARFRADLDAVCEVARKTGRAYLELSGRRNELECFQAADSGEVLGVQIQAGGLGVDLTRARYAVYYSLGFSLGDYEQSLARVRRAGQRHRVLFYHLVSQDTVDERVYQALRDKADVVQTILRSIRKEETS